MLFKASLLFLPPLLSSLVSPASAATCGSVTGASGCGDGYGVLANSANTVCYGAACEVGYAGAADQAHCCEDKSGTCSGPGLVCGPGFAYCAQAYVGKPTFSSTTGQWANPCRATCGAKPVTGV